jgi:hypothetical protein
LLFAAAEAGELEGDFAGAGVAAFRGYVIVVRVIGFVFVVGIGLVIVVRGVVIIIVVFVFVVIVLVIVVIVIGIARGLLGALRVDQFGIGEGV